MADGPADTDSAAKGTTALSAWLDDHGADLGLLYANEIKRHF